MIAVPLFDPSKILSTAEAVLLSGGVVNTIDEPPAVNLYLVLGPNSISAASVVVARERVCV